MEKDFSKIHPYVFPGLDFHGSDVTMLAFTSRVCERLSLRLQDVMSPMRHRQYVYCRFSIYYHLIRREKKTYGEVGEFFGRDHSSVVHGVQQWDNLVAIKDPMVLPIHAIANSVYTQLKTQHNAQEDI